MQGASEKQKAPSQSPPFPFESFFFRFIFSKNERTRFTLYRHTFRLLQTVNHLLDVRIITDTIHVRGHETRAPKNNLK